MRRWVAMIAVMLGLLSAPSPTLAACQLGKVVDFPVTMVGRNPIVTAQINGQDARFILDSGAFHSTIAKANALAYGLSVTSLDARLKGIGGETSMGVAVVKNFGLGGNVVPRVEFVVGGSDTGFAGLLGQNFLGLADMEYDLGHGIARLMEGKDCKTANLAYWAGGRPATMVSLEAMDRTQRHTIGTILINGVKIKAIFDTGANGSMLTLAAAKRLGVTPQSEGVVPTTLAYGLGQKGVRAWRARFDSIDIGGELIKKPYIGIADQDLGDGDMLIGIDFFLTHHVYVDNKNHRMWITYEGGPLFGLDPKNAVQNSGEKIDLTDRSAEPTDAAGYSRRGAIRVSHQQYDEAIADFDKAVTMAPDQAQYRYQRAMAHLENRQPLLGAADLDKAIELAPANGDARLARAQLRLGARDPDGALADIKAADAALAPSSDDRLRLAGLYEATNDLEPALANYDQWFKTHPEDHSRPTAFNGRCWARALLNRDLDKALADCNAALKAQPANAGYLDSRALVWMRRGELDKAQADYDAAIKDRPRNAWSLYARSIVERRAGKTAAADADRTAALAIAPKVADRAKRYGLE